jgi:hypothetical protein
MWLRSLLDSLKPRSAQALARQRRRKAVRRLPATARLRLEPLEDRSLPSFLPPVNYAVGEGPAGPVPPVEVVVADFNLDGILDQVAGNTSLLGNGDGTFHFTASLAGGEAVADFNLDGRPDVASRTGSVFLGNGDGTFEPRYLGTAGYSLAAGDLNNDGKPDAVVGYSSGDSWRGFTARLSIVHGNGDGTFGPRNQLDIPDNYGEPSSVALADLDADGLLDVLVGTDNAQLDAYDVYTVSVMWGAGGSANLPGYGERYAGLSGTLAVGDVNGDNHPDIITAFESDEVLVNLGTGNGDFAGPVSYAAGVTPRSPAVTDINGDGLLDLVIANEGRWDGTDYAGKGVSVLLGYGTGGFAAPEHFTTSDPAFDVVAGDFNGDGTTDLTVAVGPLAEPGGAAALLINDGIWTLPPPPPSITISDATVIEGNTGTQAANFTVSLSAASSQTVTVAYSTANGSASAGSDYQAASYTLTFAPGETSKPITILVNGDRLGEPNESFFVTLSAPANATIAGGQGLGTIVDDEPRMSISDVTRAEGKKDQTTLFTFTVTLSAAYDEPVTLSFRTANGTATSNNDYVAKTGTLTFAPGETTKTLTIEVKGDNRREVNEYFYLDLFGNSGNSLFSRNRGLGTILNDD